MEKEVFLCDRFLAIFLVGITPYTISAALNDKLDTNYYSSGDATSTTTVWQSKFSDIKVSFNSKFWDKVGEYDTPGGSMIALFDYKDGSAIYVEVNNDEKIKTLSDDDIDASLYELLIEKEPGTKVLDRSYSKIGSKKYRTITYSYNNPKFGSQILKHAYVKLNYSLITLSLSWPKGLDYDTSLLGPTKIIEVISTLNINNVQN